MELYQIRYFVALCETLNFARAAEQCNVSPPSLTRAVQKLEQELGGSLIHRERRLTQLTELGELVRPMLKEILSHFARTKTAAKRYLSRKKTVLRLGILPSIGPVHLAPFLGRFGAEHLGVELTLVEASLPRLNALLLGGHLDVAVMAYVGRPDKRLRYWRLYRERIVTVVPKGHRFEQFEVVRLRDLQGESFLFRTNCDMGDFLLESCRKQGFEPRIVYRSAREDWVQKMVASGFGITVMPEFTHTDPATVARPIVDPDLVRQLLLVTVAGRRHEHAGASLIHAVRAHYRHEEKARDNSEQRSPMSLNKLIRSVVGSGADPSAEYFFHEGEDRDNRFCP
jgi:LysR family transcriptional regulator, hydrogen peroxide-inducible genes activator